MKKLIYILFFALVSCAEYSHEVRYSPDGKDSIAYVRYYDGQQIHTFYMPYEQFKIVFDNQGYEGCYDYARRNELPVFWLKKYSKYKKL
jgi:hypothetical protein